MEIIAALTSRNVILQRLLSARGASHDVVARKDIEWAKSRKDALKYLAKGPVDLILLDLYMPEETGAPGPPSDVLYGFDVLRAARLQSPSPDVIVISSSARDTGYGLLQFEKALDAENLSLIPDDILWKEDYADPDFLQGKIASFLLDVSQEEEKVLREASILIPPANMPSLIRHVVRQLKRLARSAEHGRPLPDVVLKGETGTGRSMLAKAFHLLRAGPADRRLGFEFVDLRSISEGGGDAVTALTGVSGGDRWALGALPRSTYYTRSGDWVRLPGQAIEEGSERHVIDGAASVRLYPMPTDRAGFDASGTLYLGGLYNLNEASFKQLEAILSPELDSRYVTTRGVAPMRLHVGPSVVLAAGELYIPRLGEVVIDVPPIRKMGPEERQWLLHALVNRRREVPTGVGGGISVNDTFVDSTVRNIIGSELSFGNNLDDMQAIANLVLPEERSITWRHIRAAWERDSHRRHSLPLAAPS